MLEVIENVYVDLVERPVEFDELSEGVLEIVLLLQLEDWLMNLLAEPNDGLADQVRCPLARTDHPRCDESGQHRG